MSKKIIIILILLVLIIVLVIGFFLFYNNDTGEEVGPRESNFFGNFLSGLKNNSGDQLLDGGIGGQDNLDDDLPQGESSRVLFQQLTTMSISGAMATSTILPNTTIENTVVRYVDRATGNIFEIDPTSLVENRLTNTTIPGIREVMWHENGEQLIMRYLDDGDVIKSVAATIGDSFEEGGERIHDLDVTFMDNDIPYIVSSEARNQVLYFSQTKAGGIVGLSANFDSSDRKVVLESPHAEWIPQWTENSFALTTKASGVASGYLYFVDKNGDFEKIIGGVLGLTTNTSPSGKTILYSESAGGVIQLYVLNVLSRAVKELSISTLPEKCAWSSKTTSVAYCGVPAVIVGNIYPDIWYQGVVSFSDNIWEIDIESDATRLLVNPVNIAGTEIDVINPFLGPNEEFLFFTNKKDSTLWSLRLDK